MSCAVSDAPEPTPEVPAVYQPYVCPSPMSARPLLNRLSVAAPFGWLRQGWQDLWRAPSVSLFFGVCFFVMGLAVLLVFKHAPLLHPRPVRPASCCSGPSVPRRLSG